MNITLSLPVMLLAASSPAATNPASLGPLAQEPSAVVRPVGDEVWSDGIGAARSYRSALGRALEHAIASASGSEIGRNPSLQSRLRVVTEHEDGDRDGWFVGDSGSQGTEHTWVARQLAGFVHRYEVVETARDDRGDWQVAVRALVGGPGSAEAPLVVELVDEDLRQWRLERFEDGAAGRPFDRRSGACQVPRVGEYLRKSGAIKTVAEDAVGGGGEPDPAATRLAASHRVVVEWQPMQVRSLVEKASPARPTAGPRPEAMSAGSVRIELRVEDLVEGTVLLAQTFTVVADAAASFPIERLDAFVAALADKAKATVASKIYFALRPPVVVRKWAGDGGEWFVEVRIPKRVAAGFARFAVGNDGSLASPDWRSLGEAALVGGSDDSCTFRLDEAVDAGAIEAGTTQLRPQQS